MASHTGRVITRDQILNCEHEFAPDVDNLTFASPAPLQLASADKYPVPMPGLNLDAKCNLLYVNPIRYFFMNTNTSGTTHSATSAVLTFPIVPDTFGVKAAVQAAWDDSVTGFFSVTQAEWTTLPQLPLGPGDRWMISSNSLSATVGGRTDLFLSMPLPRLAYQ